jgi:deoxyribonuclease-4
MPYLPNLASAKIDMYEKSVDALTVEVDRCGRLGIPYLVTHLGSHLGEGRESGLARIGAAVNRALASTASGVMLLLENTAGTRNSMGSTFEDVLGILNEVRDGGRVGVCLDTAHAYAAGYDLHTESSVADAVRKFDAVIGLSRLKVVHLNDSAVGLGGGRDRHEHIGMGYIGEAGCRAILRNDNLSGLPFIMETPVDARRGCAGDLSKALELAGS